MNSTFCFSTERNCRYLSLPSRETSIMEMPCCDWTRCFPILNLALSFSHLQYLLSYDIKICMIDTVNDRQIPH